MPPMQSLSSNSGFSPTPVDNDSPSPVHEPALMRPPMEDDRVADELEAHSIKWNVARIVRLSSGRYALLTHYRAGALDIVKVGTLEEIAPFIPTAEQCEPEARDDSNVSGKSKAGLSSLLADIGLT